jgi:uncharacterized protein YjeT (DUF2065 family)
MITERAVEIFCLLAFGLCGLSMLLRPSAWRSFLQALASDGASGALVLGVMTLGLGAFIVSFHRVWHGYMTVLTVVGWIHVIEGAIFFLAPAAAVSWFRWAADDARTGVIRFAGFIGVVLAIAIGVILASLQIPIVT